MRKTLLHWLTLTIIMACPIGIGAILAGPAGYGWLSAKLTTLWMLVGTLAALRTPIKYNDPKMDREHFTACVIGGFASAFIMYLFNVTEPAPAPTRRHRKAGYAFLGILD